MKASLLRLALLATVMLPAASAFAADLDPPPPVDDLRPATYDWTGAYVGVIGSVVSIEGHYDKYPDCVPGGPACPPVDPEMSGSAFGGGFIAGFNYQMDSFLLGIEGDYQWYSDLAQNREPAELTDFQYNGFGTVRARAGLVHENTLFYATGGMAFIDAEFGGEVGPIGASDYSSDQAWLTGWVIGGGMEHAFSENFHGRLEYLYVGVPDQRYRLEDRNGFGGDVVMHTEHIHTVRAALTYNFSL